MGAPTLTQVHAWTDKVAAMLLSDLTGLQNKQLGAAQNPLWDQVLGSGDPDVLDTLLTPAVTADAAALPENLSSVLPALLAQQYLRGFAAALARQVTTGGGGAASFRAYLAAVGAKVHPLFAELYRSVSSEGAFTDSPTDVTTVFAPNYQCRRPARAYAGADGALVDMTTAAGNATAADMAFFTANNQALYLGSRHKFNGIVLGLSTLANVTIAPTIQYWNGSAWVAIPGATDNSAGLTKNDLIQFTSPADWGRCAKDAGGTAFADKSRLYYIRIARTAATVGTPPVGTCVSLIPVVVPQAAGGPRHLGVDQPPLAIGRVGNAALTWVVVAGVDYTRFAEPGIGLRALTPFGAAFTPTIPYVNQAGANASQAQGAWNSPAALDTVAVTLAGADTGVRSVQSVAGLSSGNAPGIFEVYAAELRTPAL